MADSFDDIIKGFQSQPKPRVVQIEDLKLKYDAVKALPDPKTQMTFGKHYGLKFDDVPPSYLYWCYHQDFVEKEHPALYKYCVDMNSAGYFDQMLAEEEELMRDWMDW